MVRAAYTPEQTRKAFWAKVDRTDDCWLWTAAKTTKGYGLFKVNGKQTTAHRASFLIAGCDLPDNIVPDHLCGNPACVRFDHLELVTYGENNLRRWRGADPKGYLGLTDNDNE